MASEAADLIPLPITACPRSEDEACMADLKMFLKGVIGGTVAVLIASIVAWILDSIIRPNVWYGGIPYMFLPLFGALLLVFAFGFYISIRARIMR